MKQYDQSLSDNLTDSLDEILEPMPFIVL
jgi:hypothetical protein